ncbi:MAG: uroporphyrinogen-III synthase [Rhizobiales bacterium]|nr:uroporphyrinogen-III synthase [Hyphomicrobiales bacterium]
MRLLVTRPALRAQGHDVMLAPMLRIEPVVDADFGAPPWSAVLLTSANAARTLAIHPRRDELAALPVLTVGSGTADAARAAGFADVTSADGDARDLVRLVAARFAGAKAPLLYLAGADRAADVAGALAPYDLAVHTVVAYRAMAMTVFPSDARAALEAGAIEAVLHFSRRSAESYLACGRDVVGPSLAPALLPVGADRRAAPGRGRGSHRSGGAPRRAEPVGAGRNPRLMAASRTARRHAKAAFESSRMMPWSVEPRRRTPGRQNPRARAARGRRR